MVSSDYREEPEASRQLIIEHVKRLYPQAEERQIRKLLK